jgi:hypothetical protein
MAKVEDIQHKWAMASLAKDELFARMPEPDRCRIILEAINFGSHLAKRAREQLVIPFGPEAISEMLEALGCVVRIDEKSGLPGPMSEYEEELGAALFFLRRIRETASKAIEENKWTKGWYDLYAQCLARELFHHMEHTLSGKASHHIRFGDRFLGLVSVSRPVETAREIACLVFVRDLMGLNEIPLMMRYA